MSWLKAHVLAYNFQSSVLFDITFKANMFYMCILISIEITLQA